MELRNKQSEKKSNAGRKPIEDKKVLIRLYIRKSIIESNGGIENSIQKCEQTLINKQ